MSGPAWALRCDQAVLTQECFLGKGRAPLRDFPGGIAGRGSGNLGISQADSGTNLERLAGRGSWRGKAWDGLERCEEETGLAPLLPSVYLSASLAALGVP